jgi:hypothetical protein
MYYKIYCAHRHLGALVRVFVCPRGVKNIRSSFLMLYQARGYLCSTSRIYFKCQENWDNVVGIVARIRAGEERNNCLIPDRVFLFYKASRLGLESVQLPIQLVSGGGGEGLSPGIKQSWREADYLPPSNAELRNNLSYISIAPYAFTVCTGTTEL